MNTTLANGLSGLAIGLLSAVLGGILGALLGLACVRWHRISGFEGGSGYAVVGFIVVGIVLGFFVGLATYFVWGTGGSFLRGAGISLGSVIGVAAVATLVARLSADVAPRVKGMPLEVVMEIRLPKGFQDPASLKTNKYGPFVNVLLNGGRYQPHGPLEVTKAKQVLGRWVVPAVMRLDTSVAQKSVRASFNDEWDAIFPFPMRSVESLDFEWSRWLGGFWSTQKGWDMTAALPPEDQRVEMRYRIRLKEPAAPEPTYEEVKRAAEEEQRQKFEAVPADAPLREWITYTRHGIPENQRKKALERILRPEAEKEYFDLVLSTNRVEAREALALLEHCERVPAGAAAAMVRYGRELADRFEAANATKEEEDPSFEWAAEVAMDFYPWINGMRILRDKGAAADLAIVELRRILALSRIRQDSQVVQGDVRRISSFYLHQWAGVPPEPGDPKPR